MPHKDSEKRKEYKRKWYKENLERCRANCEAWRKDNPDKVKKSREKYKKTHSKKIAAYEATDHARMLSRARKASYRKRHRVVLREKEAERRKRDRPKIRKSANEWSRRNRHKVLLVTRKRRAQKKNATVPLTEKEKETMLVLELTRKRVQKKTRRKHHLDHIIPLDHGGIHHPCNLRVLKGSENTSKSNKITPEALALVGENYRLYYERIGSEKAEWFRDKIAAEIGLEIANRLIGSERAAPPTVGTLEDLLT